MTQLDIPLQAAVSGMQASLVHTSNGDPIRMMVAVGQVLYWACALDERLQTVREYQDRRDANHGTRILPALKVGRNAISHGLLVIAHPHEATDDDVPIVWRQARWAEIDSFAPGMGHTPARRSVQLWRDEVEGEIVSFLLHATVTDLIIAANRYLTDTGKA